MTDADLISTLRTRLAYHETEAERGRKMLAIAEDDGPVRIGRKSTKANGSGEQRRPPSEGKPGKRAAKREAALAKLRELLAKDPDISITQAAKKAGVSEYLAKVLMEELRG